MSRSLITKLLIAAALLSCRSELYAKGKADAAPEKQNPGWKLCITQFDTSELPLSQIALGRVVTINLVSRFSGMEYTLRNGEEYDYYWTLAWIKSQNEIAKQIADKQSQRDRLLYSQDPAWRTKKQRAQLDKDIEALRLKLEGAEMASPNIEGEPLFKLSDKNLSREFPAPPVYEGEYALCKAQDSDALLFGKVKDYHGRVLVELKLWAVWKRGIVYEDKALFSVDDIDLALDEFAARLINTISGMTPSTIVVTASPENAVIVVDDLHAGRGKSEEIDRTPGPVEVTVFAENHVTMTETLELYEGERAEVSVDLKPVPTASFSINTSDLSEAKVYAGGMYAGDAPLALEGPLFRYKQLILETGDGRTAQALFQIKTDGDSVNLRPRVPAVQGRTEKARKGFYGALGRLWIIAPIAFVSVGFNNVEADAFRNAPPSNQTQDKFDSAQRMYYFSTGAMIVLGIAAVDMLVRLGIYLYQGSKEGSVLVPVKHEESAQAEEAPPLETLDTPEDSGEAASPQEAGMIDIEEVNNGRLD